jgi:hypothetical protein
MMLAGSTKLKSGKEEQPNSNKYSKRQKRYMLLFFFAFSFQSQVVTFGHTLKTIVFFPSFFLFGQN